MQEHLQSWWRQSNPSSKAYPSRARDLSLKAFSKAVCRDRTVHARLIHAAQSAGQLLHERHGHVATVLLLLLLLLLACRPVQLLRMHHSPLKHSFAVPALSRWLLVHQ